MMWNSTMRYMTNANHQSMSQNQSMKLSTRLPSLQVGAVCVAALTAACAAGPPRVVTQSA
ncbi:hypothetical protein GCM10009809_29830 [Isoptericola hypogeus]|uniref:Uncharacterized protein n=1 Tax=Isoptericola hypogeus TaxID=300179 RepID=A0ABP4VTS1_9MICO